MILLTSGNNIVTLLLFNDLKPVHYVSTDIINVSIRIRIRIRRMRILTSFVTSPVSTRPVFFHLL